MDLGITKKENWDSFEIVYEPGLLIDSSIISKEITNNTFLVCML